MFMMGGRSSFGSAYTWILLNAYLHSATVPKGPAISAGLEPRHTPHSTSHYTTIFKTTRLSANTNSVWGRKRVGWEGWYRPRGALEHCE